MNIIVVSDENSRLDEKDMVNISSGFKREPQVSKTQGMQRKMTLKLNLTNNRA